MNKEYYYKKILLIFIFSIFTTYLYSENSNYNKETLKARELIFDFKFTEADLILKKHKSPISFYLQSYSNFLENLLIGGIDNYNKYSSQFDITLENINKIDDDDSLKNVLISEIYLQSSIVKLMNRDFMSGSYHFIKSYNYLEKSIEKQPNLKLNKKLSGIFKIIVGITPEKGKKFIKLLGLEGNLQDGYKDLNTYLKYSKKNKYLFTESYALIRLIKVFFKENLNIKSIPSINLDNNNSVLIMTEILKNYKLGEYDKISNNIEKLTSKNTDKVIPILYYFNGIALTTNNYNNAITYLLKYKSTQKTDNFVKATNWQLARIYLLKQDNKEFIKYKQLTIEQGEVFTSADKQALQESNTIPNIILLKARLLFDAKKYNESYKLLINNDLSKYNSRIDKAEYLYRLGRVELKNKNVNRAKINFLTVLKDYRDIEKYFIPYSALEMAYIFKEEKNKEKEKYYYNLTLYLNKYGYSNSIKQKATNGLQQIN